MMLKWYKKLYIGDNAKKKADVYRKKIDQGKPLFDIYVITIASNEKNLLDIVSSNQLIQKPLRRMCPMIVGLANGYGEVLDVVRNIVEETYGRRGDLDVRRYLEERLAEEKEDEAGE